MNNIAKISIVALLAASSFVSCIKESLPTSVVTTEQAAASPSALEGMAGAIASNMVMLGGAAGGEVHYDFGYPAIMLATDALAGDFVCTSNDGATGYDWFSNFSQGRLAPNYYSVYHFWVNYYIFVKSANDLINSVEAAPSPQTLQYEAIGKAYRALFYLDMARLYDPFENDYTDVSAVEGLTVPYVSNTTDESQARNNPRVPRDEMFKYILADLDRAEEIFTTEGVALPTSAAYPSLSVVYGLKARLYLWMGGFDESKYADAAEYARKAIDESGCVVMDEATWTNPTTGFNTPNSAWMWYMAQSSENVNNLMNYVAWLSPEQTWGYASVNAIQGFGLKNRVYDRMHAADFRKKVVKAPGSKLSKYAGYTTIKDEAQFAGISNYSNMKFRPAGGELIDYKSGNATSIPLMRVEEMYFIEAEAIAHTNASQGASLLNAIMSQRASGYTCKVSSSEAVVEEIIFQKGVEFWGEGIIFYDYKRLKMGINNGYAGTNICTDYRYNIDGVAPWWNMCLTEGESEQNVALKGLNNPTTLDLVELWEE